MLQRTDEDWQVHGGSQMETLNNDGDGPPTGGSSFVVDAQTKFAISALATATFTPPQNLMVAFQSLILPGDKVDDGVMIQAVNIPWIRIANELNKDPDFLLKIDPRKFEELIAASYKQAGFDEVILTPHSDDKGRDVIAVRHGYVTVRVIDQAKRNGPNNLVDANDVRALVGVLLSDHSATHGVVTTTSDFAPKIKEDPSIKLHLPNRLQLINGTDLVKRLKGLV
jgi:restriction system protein